MAGFATELTLYNTAQVPLAQAWARFVPVDLTRVFPNAQGPIPAVVDVRDQTGQWDVVGQTRSVVLGDGMVVTEEILASDPSDGAPPNGPQAQFAYRVFGFSGPLGWLTDEARGSWTFVETGDRTKIIWHYAFRARFGAVRPVLAVIISVFWRRFMEQGLTNVVRILEDHTSPAV